LDKILNDRGLKELILNLQVDVKWVGLCHGTFDLFHIGHVRYLQEAKSMCDVLVVSVTDDEYVRKGAGRPIYSTEERMEVLASLDCVDYVVPSREATITWLIKELQPHYYFKGSEYSNTMTPGLMEEIEALSKYGGAIYYTTSPTITKVQKASMCEEVGIDNRTVFMDTLKSKFRYEDIVEVFDRSEEVKVLVISDAILDEYKYWSPMDRAPKTSIVAGELVGIDRMAGGGIYIANHAAEYAGSVTLLTRLGTSMEDTEFIREKLSTKVDLVGIECDSIPMKSRYVYVNQAGLPTTTSEICSGVRPTITPEYSNELEDYLIRNIDQFDIVIVGDFGHGTITEGAIGIINSCTRYKVLNVQNNESNLGFNSLLRYNDMDYITLDISEAEFSIGSRVGAHTEDTIQPIAREIAKATRSGLIAVTAGRAGTIMYSAGKTCRVPVFTTNVVDAIGAGDVFMTVSGVFSYFNHDPLLVGFVGNCAGALKVSTMCTSSIVQKALLLDYMKDIIQGVK
jgi:rfaE bifunctional protein nucleotidyltransferase chain/domain